MTQDVGAAIRGDCLVAASASLPALRNLAGQRIAVTGGTGFLGTWIAELITALNDEFQLRIKLDVLSANATRRGRATRALQGPHGHPGT